jgi:hypothetical protein
MRLLADRRQHFDPIDPRQHEIEHNRVRRFLLHETERGRSIWRGARIKALALKELFKQEPVRHIASTTSTRLRLNDTTRPSWIERNGHPDRATGSGVRTGVQHARRSVDYPPDIYQLTV